MFFLVTGFPQQLASELKVLETPVGLMCVIDWFDEGFNRTARIHNLIINPVVRMGPKSREIGRR